MKDKTIEKAKELLQLGWLRAFLIATVVGAAIASVYYGDDRWSAFSAIGTWVTGLFAGLIAWIQYKDQKSKTQKSLDKALEHIKGVHQTYSLRLLNLCIEARRWATSPDVTAQDDPFANLCLYVLSNDDLWPDIELTEEQQAHFTHAELQAIKKNTEAAVKFRADLKTSIDEYKNFNLGATLFYRNLIIKVFLFAKSMDLLQSNYDSQFIKRLEEARDSVARKTLTDGQWDSIPRI